MLMRSLCVPSLVSDLRALARRESKLTSALALMNLRLVSFFFFASNTPSPRSSMFLVPWTKIDSVLHLEPPNPNVRCRASVVQANCNASHRIIIWGHHPFVMKPLLAIGFLHLVLGLTRE